jgi:hypothetical protein
VGLDGPHPVGEPARADAKVTWITGRMGQAMWISNADANGDGRIDLAEWLAWDGPVFAKLGVPANWRGTQAAAAAH